MQTASALDFNGIITSKSNKGFETLICFSRGKCCKIIKSEGGGFVKKNARKMIAES